MLIGNLNFGLSPVLPVVEDVVPVQLQMSWKELHGVMCNEVLVLIQCR